MNSFQKYIYCLPVSLIIFVNAQSQVKYSEGLFSQRTTIYIDAQDSNKIVFNTNDRSWFRDNTVIEEIGIVPSFFHDVFIDNRFKGVRYVYKNFNDSTVYEYGSMTDTATCLGIYKLFSDIELTNGTSVNKGFLFITPVAGPSRLADTTIDNITYKRFSIETDTAGLHVMNTHYLQCDYPDILSLTPWHNKILGCPTMTYVCSTVEFMPKGTGEFGIVKNTLVRDSLTEEEIKVFDTWVQYAKNNPFKEKQVVKKKVKKRRDKKKK